MGLAPHFFIFSIWAEIDLSLIYHQNFHQIQIYHRLAHPIQTRKSIYPCHLHTDHVRMQVSRRM